MDFLADSAGYDFTGTAQRAFIRFAIARCIDVLSDVVRIQPHDITQRGVALQRQEFLIVIYRKDRFGRIVDTPDDRDSDFHRIAQAVVDFLLVVIQRHHFQRDFLGRHNLILRAVAGCDRPF